MSSTKKEDTKSFEAFQKELPKLTALRGKYFLMRQGKIINYYNTLDDAYSTGAAVYADKDFSICFLSGAKKSVTSDPESKRTAKKKLGKSGPLMATVAPKKNTPKKTDVPGYDSTIPDQGPTQFEDAARALRIKPFYKGPGARPFKCLEAAPTWTTSYSNSVKPKTGWHNDFRLTEACRWAY
jgi:hypothetical protein